MLLRLRSEFPVTKQLVYLNHAGVGPTSSRVCEAVEAWFQRLANYGGEFPNWREQAQSCREKFANLVGASPHEIAFIRNTSHGLGLIAEGLEWRPGERIAVADQVEYPSNVHAWHFVAKRLDLRVDTIPTEGGVITPAGVSATLRPSTRLLAVSSAQFGTGAVADLDAIGRICREKKILFCVDGIQTLGATPIDVKKMGIHFLAADSHKWLLGMTGIGALFIDDSVIRSVRPTLIGWKSMQNGWAFDSKFNTLRDDYGRFEEGSPAYALIVGFSAALGLLEEAGVERIADRIRALTRLVASRLEHLEFEVGPPCAYRHHILTLRHPRVASEEIVSALLEKGFVLAARQGNVRISPHFYNTEGEIRDFTVALLETIDALDSTRLKGS